MQHYIEADLNKIKIGLEVTNYYFSEKNFKLKRTKRENPLEHQFDYTDLTYDLFFNIINLYYDEDTEVMYIEYTFPLRNIPKMDVNFDYVSIIINDICELHYDGECINDHLKSTVDSENVEVPHDKVGILRVYNRTFIHFIVPANSFPVLYKTLTTEDELFIKSHVKFSVK